MRILGTKFWGHDCAFYYLDTDAREIFAVSTERVTRRKHEGIDVTVALERFPQIQPALVVHSYAGFGDQNQDQENRRDGVLLLLQEKLARELSSAGYGPDPSGEHLVPKAILKSSDLYEQVSRIMQLQGNAAYSNLPDNGGLHRTAVEQTFGFLLARCGRSASVEFASHHLCHAASAYFTSPYSGGEALVVTLDGWGDECFGKTFVFSHDGYAEIGKSPAIPFEHAGRTRVASIGELYAAFTEGLGFRKYSDEGKVEALAALGAPDPAISADLRAAAEIRDNGIHLDPRRLAKYYDPGFIRSTSARIGIAQCSATIQAFLEDIVVRYIESLKLPRQVDALCLAGGVAANVILNLKIFERCRFGPRMYVAPYMADEGSACGAAIIAALRRGNDVGWIKDRSMPYFGPDYDRSAILHALEQARERVRYDFLGAAWPRDAASSIHASKVIGLFQGRMEFGPRALGNRSILGNPTHRGTRDRINRHVKRRPPWQPLCPSVLETERERLFEASYAHKHMAIAFRLRREFLDALPSAAHVDGTARPQFVCEEDNPSYFALLTRLKELTGFGVAINTSFNLHGRAMVMTPADALTDFLDCGLDLLYIGGYRVEPLRR